METSDYIEGTSCGYAFDGEACSSCNRTFAEGHYHTEYDCRRNQFRASRKNRLLPFFIVSYGISRHYGGPEEGGWYYDNTTINEVARVFTYKQAREAIRRLKEEYPTCPRGRGSVIGGDDEYIKVCYDECEFPRESHGSPGYS